MKANDGFLQPSLQAFNQYWDRVANGYGLNGAAAQFSLSDVDPITGRTANAYFRTVKVTGS